MGLKYYRDLVKDIDLRQESKVKKERARSAHQYQFSKYQKDFTGAGGTITDLTKSLMKQSRQSRLQFMSQSSFVPETVAKEGAASKSKDRGSPQKQSADLFPDSGDMQSPEEMRLKMQQIKKDEETDLRLTMEAIQHRFEGA